MSFPKYEAYKESGVEWLGEVPEHWDMKRLKHLSDSLKAGPFGSALTKDMYASAGYRIYGQEQVIPNDFSIGDYFISQEKFEELRQYEVKPDDILISCVGTFGKVAVAPQDIISGIINPRLIRLRSSKLVHPYYLTLVLRSKIVYEQFSLLSRGGTMDVINIGTLSDIFIPVHPHQEQTQITRFLDHETARIDALIAEQERLIELLKEKRQAVISHAVTKGLAPTAPMRDSGVEWLGEVPKHWRVLKLTRVLQNVEQGWSPNASNQSAEMGEWGVIKISAIKKGIFVEYENKALLENTAPEISLEIKNGDLLVTRANTPNLVGDACVVQKSPDAHLMLSDLVYRLRLEKNIDARFICFFLISDYGRAQIKGDARGSSMSMAKISQGHIKGWSVGLPDYSEQVEIANHIDRNTSKLNELINQAHEGIELLQERRSALISAAVTGKIDVRNWKAPVSDSPVTTLETTHG